MWPAPVNTIHYMDFDAWKIFILLLEQNFKIYITLPSMLQGFYTYN